MIEDVILNDSQSDVGGVDMEGDSRILAELNDETVKGLENIV